MTCDAQHEPISFDGETHVYTANGQRYPSVTQVLKDAGIIDTSQPWYTDWHRDRGKYVHAAIEMYDKGTLDYDSLDPALVPYVDGWVAFLKSTGATVQHCEQRAYDPDYKFAGTIDRVLWLGWVPTVADIKCGPHERWHGLQTAGYQILYPKCSRRISVHLSGDGRFKVHEHKDLNDKAVFLSAVNLYHWRHAA